MFSFTMGIFGFMASAAFACGGYVLGCHETNLRRDMEEMRRLSDTPLTPAPAPAAHAADPVPGLTEEQERRAREDRERAEAFAQMQNYGLNNVYRAGYGLNDGYRDGNQTEEATERG